MKYEVHYLLSGSMIMIKNENGEALFCEGTFKQFKDLCQELSAYGKEYTFYVEAAPGGTALTYMKV